MTNVLWFSRHSMTETQLESLKRKLGEIKVTQIDRTIKSAYELSDEIKAADVVAIVAPLNLQSQFLKLAGTKPVITAISDRVLVKSEDGTESKVQFVFNHWERIMKIDVQTELFAD